MPDHDIDPMICKPTAPLSSTVNNGEAATDAGSGSAGLRARHGVAGRRASRSGLSAARVIVGTLGALAALSLGACSIKDLSYLQTGAGGSSGSSSSTGGGSSSAGGGSSSAGGSSSSTGGSSSSAGGSSSSTGEGGWSPGWAIETSRVASSYVTVTDLAIPVDFTIETWVKPIGFAQEQIVLSKQVAVVQENQFRLGIDSGRAYFMMTDGNAAGGLWTPATDYVLAKPIVAGVWTHLAVTKSGAMFVLYVNGVSSATFTSIATLQHTGTALFEVGSAIAVDGVSPEKILDGTIDEVRIWDIARPGAEIAMDMGRAITSMHPKYSHLVAYYQLDDGSGTVATDTKGKHPGTLINAPTWVMSTAPTGK